MSKNRRQFIALGAVDDNQQALCQLFLTEPLPDYFSKSHEKRLTRVSLFFCTRVGLGFKLP
jgi:hypothetical protein